MNLQLPIAAPSARRAARARTPHRGREATVVAQPLDDLHVLVVTCAPDVNLVLLGRVLARITATPGP